MMRREGGGRFLLSSPIFENVRVYDGIYSLLSFEISKLKSSSFYHVFWLNFDFFQFYFGTQWGRAKL